MYRQYFPLLALTSYAKATAVSEEERLRVVREAELALKPVQSRVPLIIAAGSESRGVQLGLSTDN